MNKPDLLRSALAQAKNVSRIRNPQAKKRQIRYLLATLKQVLK